VQQVPSTARMRGAQLFAQPISASISRLFLLQSSRQLCHIRSTIECCQAAGIGVAACCEMAKAQTVAHEYRKQAGVERCFTAAPGVKKCAKRTENCASTGCCEDAGHTCYEKDLWWSGCLSTCTPGMKDPFGKHGHWSCRKAGLSARRRGALLHQ